jgi:hypothetical protein
MLENIDGDIVAYYKKLIMKNILANISEIEDKVEYEIRKEIFGEDSVKPKKKNNIKLNKTNSITKKRNRKKIENLEEKPVENDIEYNEPLTNVEDIQSIISSTENK